METFVVVITCVFAVAVCYISAFLFETAKKIKELRCMYLEVVDKNYQSKAETDDSIDKCMEAVSKCVTKVGELASSVEKMQESINKVDEVIDEMDEAAKTYNENEKAFKEGLNSILNFSAPTYKSKGDEKK